LLTTNGLRTGLERTTVLGYLDDGDGWIVPAANAGRDASAAWFLNLRANPAAVVQ
jgi:deazaflavin-dependent oxidoreductase (nitroreductase family)